MTTLTSLIRPAAPRFPVVSRRPALRGLVVFCMSALVTAAFVLDVARGAAPRPERLVAQQAVQLT